MGKKKKKVSILHLLTGGLKASKPANVVHTYQWIYLVHHCYSAYVLVQSHSIHLQDSLTAENLEG